ncbi:Aspartate/ornithine carbamoyltransferase [Russula brevipes]|nr:Aspartate/ornithine carbamoyltransferase [Russula brevipes]
MAVVPHLMTLADLSVSQINRAPRLQTRARVSAETAALFLSGRALFSGKEDIHLGVTESPRDTARGIFARVGDHSEIDELAEYSPVPVLNAILHTFFEPPKAASGSTAEGDTMDAPKTPAANSSIRRDSANVLHDKLVTYPRLGHSLRIATPPKPSYQAPAAVWDRVKELKCDEKIWWGADLSTGANIVVTDAWVSMTQEAEYEQRMRDFTDYQVTAALCREGGALKMLNH